MVNRDIENAFPGLSVNGYCISSPVNPAYNCVAWAAGETQRWWDPSPGGGYYWPVGVPPVLSLAGLIAAFAALGYEPCANGHAEPGFEKVAVYADLRSWPTHVARQLPSGAWTSKLGACEDIEHNTLEALEGALYGKVAQCLRRKA